jgi:hypothetical protein
MDDSVDSEREDVFDLPRKLDGRVVDHRHHEKEIRQYFDARHARLEIVCTTNTPLGQIIDWIPIGSQLKDGTQLAEAPPLGDLAFPDPTEGRDRWVRFELENPKVERGPEGTVPVLRKNLEGISFKQSLRKLIGKYPFANFEGMSGGRMTPQPSIDGPHWHASARQKIICFGGQGMLSAFDPYCECPDDFSLMQIHLSNSDTGRMQTLEAGWQERKDSYGDWYPHLFTYYTTNGYTDDDDDKGGYNQDVDGWIQVDGSIHPGSISRPNSTKGGDQYVMPLKYQLYKNNWWLMCNGRWIGYYPARLFMGNQSLFTTLGDHADQISFYGEVYDSTDVPGKTRTDMGSGYWPEYGWQLAAYQRNLLVQTDRAGGMSDFDGVGGSDAPDMYDIETHMLSGSDWGSYCWLGGPGRTTA